MPITALTPPTAPEDLPGDALPDLQRIARSERVGPTVANRQVRQLEKRTVTLVSKVNELISTVNGGGGGTGDLNLNNFRAINAADGTASNHLVTKGQMEAAIAAGGNSGLKNYVLNPGAESSTYGWATYDDAAGIPTDGTGGTASITLTRTTATALSGAGSFSVVKGAANRQGEGCSYDFSIDPADTNKRLTVSADIRITGVYAAGSVTVWVYDVTRATLCAVSTENSVWGSGEAKVTFSTSDSLNYRIIFHVASSDTNNWTMLFDNVFVGVIPFAYSVAASDWIDAGNTTVTGSISNPTKGTTALDRVSYSRIGDRARIRFAYDQTAAGSAGSGSYFLHLPVGLALDTGKVTTFTGTLNPVSSQAYAIATVQLSHGGNMYYGLVVPYDATRLVMYAMINTGSSSGPWESAFNGSGYGGSSVKYSFEMDVPISGWSGSMAVQPGHRFLWAEKYGSSAVRVTTTPSKPGEYRSLVGASDSPVTPVPSTADGFKITGNAVSPDANEYQIYIGRGRVVQMVSYAATGRSGAVHAASLWADDGPLRGCVFHYDPSTGVAIVKVPRGSGVVAGFWLNADSTTITAFTSVYFDILVADDPVPVAQAPTVHLEAVADANQAVTVEVTDIAYQLTVVDKMGTWSGTVFTAPVGGIYLINAIRATAGVPVPSSIGIWKNGVHVIYGNSCGPSTTDPILGVSQTMSLQAGDQITLRNSQSVTLLGDAVKSRLSITRIGDT